MNDAFSWWQHGVIYEVYPRSFLDSDGDGVGDLRGIRAKLDYLSWLGVDALWLTPIYRSPMEDFGYDVADYCDVDPAFGTLDDVDRLIARRSRARAAGHPRLRAQPHVGPAPVVPRVAVVEGQPEARLVHLARPGAGRRPAEQLAEQLRRQRLDWTRPPASTTTTPSSRSSPTSTGATRRCRQAMFDVLRFWLDRGIDGFRIDVIWQLIKDEEFRDNPLDPNYADDLPPHRRYLATYNTDRPRCTTSSRACARSWTSTTTA